ncbi:hypothetical protein FM107_20000 [Sphingobacterium sp. JB170]|nr:hypothetical protein FM107_20000 [Sphingobacterium sp. JB170]
MGRWNTIDDSVTFCTQKGGQSKYNYSSDELGVLPGSFLLNRVLENQKILSINPNVRNVLYGPGKSY